MKTQVSIPDAIFWRAENYARQMKLTRSAFYTQALVAFLAEANSITEDLDEIYSQEDSRLTPEYVKAFALTLKEEVW